MAQATRLAGNKANKMVGLIEALAGPAGPRHPTSTANAATLASDILMMNELIVLVRGGEPDKGTAMRRVYDSAISNLGEGSGTEGALGYLQRSLAGALQNLSKNLGNRAELGAQAAPLLKFLKDVNKGLAETKQDYIITYLPVWSDVNRLIDKMEGREVNVRLDRARPITRPVLPRIELENWTPGNVHLLSSKNDETVVVTNAQTTPTFDRLMGGQANAKELVYSLAYAHATRENHPDDKVRLTAAAERLRKGLEAIPDGREMKSSKGYTAAMTALSGCGSGGLCDLNAALNALSEETAFNTVYGALNNMYVISVNQKAVAVMRAGVTVRYQFKENVAAFLEYMKGIRKGKFEWRFLHLAVGLYYEYLAMSGTLQQLQFQPGAGPKRVGGQALRGAGNVFTIQPSAKIGASWWGDPLEIVLHCSTGFRKWEVGANIQLTDGTTEQVKVGDEGGFIGLWGAELRWPGRIGQRSRVRIERVGAGGVGENPLGYITFSGNWLEGESVRMTTYLTPEYGYFLKQHRVGAELKPLDITWQINKDWAVRGGPGIRYDVTIRPGTTEEKTGAQIPMNVSHTIEAYAGVGFTYSKGVSVDINAGYLTEKVKGATPAALQGELVPATGFASIMATLTPGQWFRSKKTATTAAIPRRAERPTPLARAYLDARTFMEKADNKALRSPKSKDMAKRLAGVVEGATLLAGAAAMRGTKSYRSAIKDLRAGRLKEGITSLRKLKTFRIMELEDLARGKRGKA